jgi:hypothetical protein
MSFGTGNWFSGITIDQAYYGARIAAQNTGLQVLTQSRGNDTTKTVTMTIAGSAATLSGTNITAMSGDLILVASSIAQSNAAIGNFTALSGNGSTAVIYQVPNGTTVPVGTIYYSLLGGVDWTLRRGISFFPSITNETYVNSLISGRVVNDTYHGVWLQRPSTISSTPLGSFLKCVDINSNDLMFVGLSGEICSFGPSNSNFSSVSAGGIATNGITLRNNTNLRLGRPFTAEALLSATGYIIVYDNNNIPYKVLARPL